MIQYTLIDSGASVLDMVGRLYGDLGLTYKFLQDNSFIDNINADLTLFPGYNVVYDDSLTNTTPPRLNFTLPPANPNILTWQSQPEQSLYDICLQTYNTLDQLYKLISDNNIDGLNGGWAPGTQFNFDATLMSGNAIYNNNLVNGTIYATAYDDGSTDELREGLSDELRYDLTYELRETGN